MDDPDSDSGEDAFMEQDQHQPDSDSPTPPVHDPNQGYREHDRFPSDPDESSMEEGVHPSSGEEEAEPEPTQAFGGAR